MRVFGISVFNWLHTANGSGFYGTYTQMGSSPPSHYQITHFWKAESADLSRATISNLQNKHARYRGPGTGVPKPTVNRSGSSVNLEALNIAGAPEIQETRRPLTFEQTDQKTLPRGGSPVTNWDGVVRAYQKKPTFENAPRIANKQEPEPSIARDPYSFY